MLGVPTRHRPMRTRNTLTDPLRIDANPCSRRDMRNSENNEHSVGNVDDDAGGVRRRWVRVGVPTTMNKPNGHRGRGPAVIGGIACDLLESPRLPGSTSP